MYCYPVALCLVDLCFCLGPATRLDREETPPSSELCRPCFPCVLAPLSSCIHSPLQPWVGSSLKPWFHLLVSPLRPWPCLSPMSVLQIMSQWWGTRERTLRPSLLKMFWIFVLPLGRAWECPSWLFLVDVTIGIHYGKLSLDWLLCLWGTQSHLASFYQGQGE